MNAAVTALCDEPSASSSQAIQAVWSMRLVTRSDDGYVASGLAALVTLFRCHDHSRSIDLHILLRTVSRSGRYAADFENDVQAGLISRPAENGVLVVKTRSSATAQTNEELRAT